jgi:hypothetical protein
MNLNSGPTAKKYCMKRSICFLTVCIFLTLAGLGQSSKTEDVVYLKNEWVIRGRIILRDEKGLSIQSGDGSIFHFSNSEIVKTTKENRWSNFVYKEKGFSSFTELGPLIAGKTTSQGVTTAAFSFQTINGYKFNQYAFLGLGVGADLYAIQTIIPIFAGFRGDLTNHGTVIPYYYANLGYGINITQASDQISEFKGGIQYAAGLGIKIPFNHTAGFLISLGYNYQATSFIEQGTNTKVDYSRLAVRAGFFL